MTSALNNDGSISTVSKVLLTELQQTAKSMEIRAEGLKNDQARIDIFMSNIKWLLSVIGALIVTALATIGFFGFNSIKDIEVRVGSNAEAAVEQRLLRDSRVTSQLSQIASLYRDLEADYEQYRTWADALVAVSADSDLANRDSRHATNLVSKISSDKDRTQEDRLRALALLEALIRSGSVGEADPNDLFNAGVDASRLGMHSQALQLAVLANHARPSVSHRAYELQMEDLFGRQFVFDETIGELVQTELSPVEVRNQAWDELLTLLKEIPRSEAEQAYSRTSNVAVRNRSSGHYQEMIDVIEETAKNSPKKITSYAYQTLATLYSWQSNEGWESDFWKSIELALEKLSRESPQSTWVQHSAQEMLKEANEINDLQRLLDLSSKYDVDLVELSKP